MGMVDEKITEFSTFFFGNGRKFCATDGSLRLTTSILLFIFLLSTHKWASQWDFGTASAFLSLEGNSFLHRIKRKMEWHRPGGVFGGMLLLACYAQMSPWQVAAFRHLVRWISGRHVGIRLPCCYSGLWAAEWMFGAGICVHGAEVRVTCFTQINW